MVLRARRVPREAEANTQQWQVRKCHVAQMDKYLVGIFYAFLVSELTFSPANKWDLKWSCWAVRLRL